MSPRRDHRNLQRAAPLILFLAAMLPYVNSLHTPFFFDSVILLDDPAVCHLPSAIRDLWRTKLQPGQEFTNATFAANYEINTLLGRPGFAPPGFIAVNIALHALNVWLVFTLVLALLQLRPDNDRGKHIVALIAAGLFAVHPLQASSILYIVQRRGMLVALFHLLALLVYIRLRSPQTAKRRMTWAAVLIMLTWLSMKSKSTGVTLPLCILALECALRLPNVGSLRKLIPWAGGVVAIWLIGVLVFLASINLFDARHFHFLAPPGAMGGLKWNALQNALTQSRAFMGYWRLAVLPIPSSLSIDHSFSPTLDYWDLRAWMCVAGHIVLLAMAAVMARSGRVLAGFGFLLFYVALVPFVLPIQPVLFVEYRTYLCLVGVALIIAEAFCWVPRRPLATAVVPASWLLLIVLFALSLQRARLFRDPITLWSDVVAKYPDQFRPRYNLGNALFKEAQYESAVSHFRQALRIDPYDHRAHFNLANTLLRLNRPEEAVPELIEVLRFKPDHAGARAALDQLGVDVRFEPTSGP